MEKGKEEPLLDQVQGQSQQPTATITGDRQLPHPNRCKDVSGHTQKQGRGDWRKVL